MGPTVGHIYAGKILSAGLGIRLLGGALSVAVLANVSYGAFGDEFSPTSGQLVALVAGGLLYLGGSIYEIVTAASAANAYNRAHETRAISLSPTPIRGRAGSAPGLALVGRF